MEIPTVKSCGCFDLKTVGLMIGFFQIFIYSVIVIISMWDHAIGFIPIFAVPLIVNLSWIYGIQEKKPVFMLPAMVPFELASLAAITFVTFFPIFASIIYTYGTVTNQFRDSDVISLYTFFAWFAGCVISALVVYITIVLYSVYKSVKKERQRLPSHGLNLN